MKKADLVTIRIHGGPSRFKKFERLKEVLEKTGRLTFIDNDSMQEAMQDYRYLFKLPDDEYLLVRSYTQMGGEENSRNLLLWACNKLGGMEDVVVPSPIKPKAEGVYHPDHGRDIDLHNEYPGFIGQFSPHGWCSILHRGSG